MPNTSVSEDRPAFPAMSVVLITPDNYGAIRKTIGHLRAQTVKNSLELVIVAPQSDNLNLNKSDLQDFYQFRVIEVGRITLTGKALAEGFRQASAPIVTYAEEHSYPEPGWAEALIRAHSGPWAGVGAVLGNANPGTMTSWAELYSDFGPWVEPAKAIESINLGGHHSAYKRAVLLEFGPLLDSLLETDLILNGELRARGYKLYLEPAAKSYHVNCSRFTSHLLSEYHGGRLFGAARARYERWSIFRRLLYIGGMPLIPIVRLWRIWKEIRRSGRQRELFPLVLPPLITGLISHTVGEATGYILGRGGAAEQRVTFELSRYRHVVKQDRLAKGFDETSSAHSGYV
jgi:glycosyltransferase involved in cell wall biosynthesis